LSNKSIVLVFLLISVFNIAFGQNRQITSIIIQSEEVLKRNNISYKFFHFSVEFLGISPDNPFPIIIDRICNLLRTYNYLPGVDTNILQVIKIDQFDKELGLSGWLGGHPLFESWNNRFEWNAIIYNSYLYIIRVRGGVVSDFYRLPIR